MDNVKAKRLNAKSRNKLIEKVKKDSTIEMLFNDNRSSWITGTSFTRSNADCMLYVDVVGNLIRANNLEDSLILEFSKRREAYINGTDDDEQSSTSDD